MRARVLIELWGGQRDGDLIELEEDPEAEADRINSDSDDERMHVWPPLELYVPPADPFFSGGIESLIYAISNGEVTREGAIRYLFAGEVRIDLDAPVAPPVDRDPGWGLDHGPGAI